MIKRRKFLSVLGLVLIMVVSACRPAVPQAPTSGPTPTPAQSPTPTPSVRIITPADGSMVTTNSVQVSIEALNFTAGQGHMHYYLDVDIPTTRGQAAVTAAGTYKSVQTTSVTWNNLSPGKHTLGVQLVNNDHTPLGTPVTAKVTITVQ